MSEIGHETNVKSHSLMCFSISAIFLICLQPSFGQAMESSSTSLLIGMLGRSWPTIAMLQSGHWAVLMMQRSQKRLWQHGVSTASTYISKHMGHSHLSSERLLAAKYEKLTFPFLPLLFLEYDRVYYDDLSWEALSILSTSTIELPFLLLF